MDDTLLIIVLVAVTGAGVAGAVLLRRAARTRALQRWQRAWEEIDSAPEEALQVFNTFLRQLRDKPLGVDGINRAQAHLGATLCLIGLKRFDEAVEEEQKARSDGAPADADELRLSEAWLKANPQPPSVTTVEAYARYLTASRRQVALERRADTALREALRIPDKGRAKVAQVADLARRVLTLLPMRDEAHFALGVALSRLDLWHEAVPALEKAADAEPTSAERRAALARAYKGVGEFVRARVAYLEAYRLLPSPAVAREAGLLCAQLVDVPFNPTERLTTGDHTPLALAAAFLRPAAQSNPEDTAVWPALGRTLARLERWADAAPLLERAATIASASADDFYLLGRSRMALGRRDAARQAVDDALRIDPEHLGAARLAGDLAFETGAFALALNYYQRLDPAESTAHAEKVARCYLEAGKPGDAVKLLADRDPLSQSGRLVLGRAHARLGDWAEALAVLQAGDIAGPSTAYRYYLANALAANGQHAEAEKMFESLCDDAHLGKRARRYLGHAKVLRGDLEGAEVCYQAAAMPTLDVDLGRLCLLRNQPGQAKTHFERILALTPGSRTARLGRAMAEGDLGDVEPLRELMKEPEMAPWAAEPLADRAYEERNYVEALTAYEQAFKGRRRIPSRALVRMAVGCLHLGRFPEALPHLVELTRRYPQLTDVRYNLALCRYHIGREHFKNHRWDPARGEFSRCDHLLKPVAPTEAEGIRRWEAEAAYRAAFGMLTTDPPEEPERAARLFEEGAKAHPNEARWLVGAALAAAVSGLHALASERFREVQKHATDRPGLAFGEALSLQAAGRHAEAIEALGRTLQLAAADVTGAMPAAARVALAGSHAALKNYAQAADELRPLLDDAHVKASKRYTPSDVAKAMVAYYALAGQRDQAAELARAHLPGESVGAMVVALVQADAGDYAGAAQTLHQAYTQDKASGIKKLLVACLLNAAAECIRQKDPKKAASVIRQVLTYDPFSKEAKRLDSALEFGRRLKNLDPKKLDEAIQECEALLKRPDVAGQIVRTLGALYHRRALQSERNGKGSANEWHRCVAFWRQRIFGDDSFWKRYADEYNAGKGRREQVKPDELAKWRQELPALFARSQGTLLAEALQRGDPEAAQRHLDLTWEWAAEFEPHSDFLGTDLRVDDPMARLLEGVLPKVKNPSAQKLVKTVQAGYWNAKGLRVLDEVARENREGIDMGKEAGRINGVSADMFNRTLEEFNNLAASLVPAQMVEGVTRAQGVLRIILEKIRVAAGLVDRAKSRSRKALGLLGDCRASLRKACELDPDSKVYADNEKTVDEIEAKIGENLRDFEKLADTISSNTRAVRDNLVELESLNRRLG